MRSNSNSPDLLVAAPRLLAPQENSFLAPIVTIVDGQARADSRDVADFFSKAHKNVLQAIQNLHVSDDFRRRNFQPFKINDLTGESLSHVSMTRDGFTFLAMGFTGATAGAFKEAFIKRFNAMEAQLRAGSVAPAPSRVPPVKEVAATFRAYHGIARLAGLDRNQASLSAGRATKAVTGVDPLEALAIRHLVAPQQEAALTPSDLGARLGGKSAVVVNKLLAQRGLQTSHRAAKGQQYWQPTAAGEPHAVWLDTGKHHGNGTPVRQLKWAASILPLIEGDAS
ncbi:Rha family transcriptional regulator [Teichococcus wenyumeiae]|uniref:Rha family transcriptional regulator n=1 Tax=Teichococcus wenyumeiae TaxID=2478470 RepID=UPI001314AE35|nr:Rha family transcriptional regulator [Pseudoroseomonas wenyumeiae]